MYISSWLIGCFSCTLSFFSQVANIHPLKVIHCTFFLKEQHIRQCPLLWLLWIWGPSRYIHTVVLVLTYIHYFNTRRIIKIAKTSQWTSQFVLMVKKTVSEPRHLGLNLVSGEIVIGRSFCFLHWDDGGDVIETPVV